MSGLFVSLKFHTTAVVWILIHTRKPRRSALRPRGDAGVCRVEQVPRDGCRDLRDRTKGQTQGDRSIEDVKNGPVPVRNHRRVVLGEYPAGGERGSPSWTRLISLCGRFYRPGQCGHPDRSGIAPTTTSHCVFAGALLPRNFRAAFRGSTRLGRCHAAKLTATCYRGWPRPPARYKREERGRAWHGERTDWGHPADREVAPWASSRRLKQQRTRDCQRGRRPKRRWREAGWRAEEDKRLVRGRRQLESHLHHTDQRRHAAGLLRAEGAREFADVTTGRPDVKSGTVPRVPHGGAAACVMARHL